MILYKCKYKLKGHIFWRTIKRVKGDLYDTKSNIKIIICEDESQYHFPPDTTFWFSKRRFLSITERAESQAGQAIPMRRR